MRARTAVLLVILVALGIFAALNWSVITTPTQLHVVVARIEAPIGVILLAVALALTLLYAVFLAWIETSALLEARRFARELQAQRQLAESAEASRYTELKSLLQTELSALRTLREDVSRDVLARIDRVEDQLRGEIERTGNTLTAYFAELEERLNRGERPAPPGVPT
jgi:uncharacterized integral membrane protein